MSSRTFPLALKVTGEQAITCTSTAKYPLNSTVGSPQMVRFSVLTSAVRVSFAANSTVPSRTAGVIYPVGGPYDVYLAEPSKFSFSSGNTTAGVIYLTGFRYAGQ